MKLTGILLLHSQSIRRVHVHLSLLAQLRMIARIKGVSTLVIKTGIMHNGTQKALSEQRPELDPNEGFSMKTQSPHLRLFVTEPTTRTAVHLK